MDFNFKNYKEGKAYSKSGNKTKYQSRLWKGIYRSSDLDEKALYPDNYIDGPDSGNGVYKVSVPPPISDYNYIHTDTPTNTYIMTKYGDEDSEKTVYFYFDKEKKPTYDFKLNRLFSQRTPGGTWNITRVFADITNDANKYGESIPDDIDISIPAYIKPFNTYKPLSLNLTYTTGVYELFNLDSDNVKDYYPQIMLDNTDIGLGVNVLQGIVPVSDQYNCRDININIDVSDVNGEYYFNITNLSTKQFEGMNAIDIEFTSNFPDDFYSKFIDLKGKETASTPIYDKGGRIVTGGNTGEDKTTTIYDYNLYFDFYNNWHGDIDVDNDNICIFGLSSGNDDTYSITFDEATGVGKITLYGDGGDNDDIGSIIKLKSIKIGDTVILLGGPYSRYVYMWEYYEDYFNSIFNGNSNFATLSLFNVETDINSFNPGIKTFNQEPIQLMRVTTNPNDKTLEYDLMYSTISYGSFLKSPLLYIGIDFIHFGMVCDDVQDRNSLYMGISTNMTSVQLNELNNRYKNEFNVIYSHITYDNGNEVKGDTKEINLLDKVINVINDTNISSDTSWNTNYQYKLMRNILVEQLSESSDWDYSFKENMPKFIDAKIGDSNYKIYIDTCGLSDSRPI